MISENITESYTHMLNIRFWKNFQKPLVKIIFYKRWKFSFLYITLMFRIVFNWETNCDVKYVHLFINIYFNTLLMRWSVFILVCFLTIITQTIFSKNRKMCTLCTNTRVWKLMFDQYISVVRKLVKNGTSLKLLNHVFFGEWKIIDNTSNRQCDNLWIYLRITILQSPIFIFWTSHQICVNDIENGFTIIYWFIDHCNWKIVEHLIWCRENTRVSEYYFLIRNLKGN